MPPVTLSGPCAAICARLFGTAQLLNAVEPESRSAISSIWELYSGLPSRHRSLLLRGLLQQSCLPQLSFLADSLNNILRIDFLAIAPKELSLKILSYLDAKSLCRAARVSRAWKRLADDDVIWHIMCEQHIDKKCVKCGWGLPLLDISKFRVRRRNSFTGGAAAPIGLVCGPMTEGTNDSSETSCFTVTGGSSSSTRAEPSTAKRKASDELEQASAKRRASDDQITDKTVRPSDRRSTSPTNVDRLNPESCILLEHPHHPASHGPPSPRPWKEIYAERYQVERNWREGHFRLKSLPGHPGGLTALHLDENSDRVVTGGNDGKVRLWNIETGKLEKEFTGHGDRCVRSVQIDGPRIWSAGMDGYIRVWDSRSASVTPVKEILAHDGAGVGAMHLDGHRLLCGLEDGSVLFWDLKTAKKVRLMGHSDFVNCVRFRTGTEYAYSASDDRTIRIWDLGKKECVKMLQGHNNAVQCLRVSPGTSDKPRLVTSGDDNTVRIWHAVTGQLLRTIFGHMEGVWGLSFDSLRVVSGGLGGRIRVWDTEDGHVLLILDPAADSGEEAPAAVARRGRAVYAVQSTDTKIVGGGEDGKIWIYE